MFVQALSSMKGQAAAMIDLDLVIQMLKTICLAGQYSCWSTAVSV